MPEPRPDWPVEQFNAPAVQLARGTLVELLGGGLHETSGAEIYGEYGIGKSQFLLGLAKRTFQDVRVETGAAGVAVLKGDATLTETSDLAMGVIKAFFHPPANYDPTPADERKALRDVKAVVLLDEWRVGDDEIGALRAMAPGLRVVAANEKSKLAILKSQLLPGLDLDDAVQLLRDALGPAAAARISDDEAKQLCDAADGNPHRIKLAGLALRNAPVAALLQRVEGRKSDGSKYPVESAVLEDLGPDELKILAVLRFFERAPVDTATIRAVAGLGEDADERVERLRDEKWVRSHSPYYSLAVPSAVVPYDEVQHAAFADAALRHLAGWAREERLNPQAVLPQLAAAWHVLDVSSEAEPRQILDLAFGIEHALAFDGRWTAW